MCIVINTHLLIFVSELKNAMRKLFYFFVVCFLLTNCNDGDIIDIELDFEDGTVELCGNLSDNHLLYNIKTDPNESLTLLFPISTANNTIFDPEVSGDVITLDINGNSIRFNYRTYNGDPDLVICEEIPNAGVDIVNDYEATSGAEAIFESTFIDDDNDGIPSEFEDDNADGDDNYLTNPLDSDGDGTPDYIDADDDNDNVLTKYEDDNIDEDDNPYTNPLNTDAYLPNGDDLPDYLDNDDDGDSVLTLYENEDFADESAGSYTLLDDFNEPSIIPRFKDNTATDEYVNDDLNPNSYERTVSVDITIENASIEILSQDTINFGTYELVITLPEDD